MIKTEKIIRIVTLPAIVTGVTLIVLYFYTHSFSISQLGISLFFLSFVPLLSYPISGMDLTSEKVREKQRSYALVFSVIGYLAGFIWSSIFVKAVELKIIFSSYIISVIFLIVFNKLLHFRASGHSCATTAPTVLLGWVIGLPAVVGGVALIFLVYRSSLNLKRHSLSELVAGSAISVAAGIISIFIHVGF